jgi:hypothetical protein
VRRFQFATLLIAAAGAATVALADRPLPSVTNATLVSECGDCHVVYPPRMLPKRSWQKLMDGLADHFGEELSLDTGTRKEVLDYLLGNAADSGGKRGHGFLKGLGPDDAPIRITETPRWRKEHRELPDSVWSDPRITFKGECNVCHTEAERGRYDDDHGLRVPGPGETWRRWDDD